MSNDLTPIERLARMAWINCTLARPGDDGCDTWYGEQYLPNGSLARFAHLVAEDYAQAMLALAPERLDLGEVADAIRARFPSVGAPA